MPFSKKILLWYSKNKRDLPWRNTTEPYRIWLSEIVLQQTRVAQGIPYYLKFIQHFPTVGELAGAKEEKVLKLWQGLGYYSRARNLHATAKTITEKYDGKFPSSYEELIKLKGVGDYTASAIASICFREQQAVVDGNVYRVLARYFGVILPINSNEGATYFKKLALKVMDGSDVRNYNQGIMEFGAIQCKPANPDCAVCPLNDSCAALKENKVGEWPVKLKKAKIRNRYFNYLVVVDAQNRTFLKRRVGKGIWQHLYEFPLMETQKAIALEEVEKNWAGFLDLDSISAISLYPKQVKAHKLSHQHLYAKFWIVKTSEEIKGGISIAELDSYPVPVLLADFIKTFKNLYF